MSFTCAIQFTGLIRGESKSKHRSNGKAILAEMGKERISKSVTLDRTRTKYNVYDQKNVSGCYAWDDMENRAENYKQEVRGKTKDGKEIIRTKGLRKDAVLGVAVIINPPYYECKNWSEKTYQKFYQDTQEILEVFKPDIFRKSNQIFGVEHRDEGYNIHDKHKHLVYQAVSEQNRYCGNELDSKFLIDFNNFYPEQMRKRGWEMDNMDTTDWKKYQEDMEYRIERKAKSRNQGKSVNKYVLDKTTKSLKESTDNAEAITELVRQIQAEIAGLEEDKIKLQADIEKQRREALRESETYKREQKEIIDAEILLYKQQQEAEIKKLKQAVEEKLRETEEIKEKLNYSKEKYKKSFDYFKQIKNELDMLKGGSARKESKPYIDLEESYDDGYNF